MKILIVGGGGREHALAWLFARDWPGCELLAAPGNPGIAALARCVPIGVSDLSRLVALAEHERPDFVLVGPEAPLAAGLVDQLRARRILVFGPTQAAARLETSKTFAKQLMLDHGIPTARAERHVVVDEARRAVRAFGAPVVVKASGLAAGKGVIVCETISDADAAIDFMLRDEGFGEAGAEILIEEFMEGEELSLFALTDGTRAIPLLGAQDHKRLLDGDRGPNTGGMGAFAPVSLGTDALVAEAMTHVIEPTLAAMRARGTPFTGLLYAGLMLTGNGARVVEFNSRFGDPETEAILPLAEPGLAVLLATVARGDSLAGAIAPTWRDAYAVTTVVAAAGYPDSPRTGDQIALPEPEPDVHVFHAGTRLSDAGSLISAGGRVLAVTAVAASLAEASRRSARHAARVVLDGKQLRTDIGWRELGRRAGASRD